MVTMLVFTCFKGLDSNGKAGIILHTVYYSEGI
jgi:hypothetical protein